MTRPVQLQAQPVFYPHVCVRCGCGTGQRDFFIDLGLDLGTLYNPLNEGNIYLCNECSRNIVTDVNRILVKWDEEHSPWESPDRVEASYSLVDQLVRDDNAGASSDAPSSESNSSDSEPNDFTVESSEPDVAESTAIPEPTVHASSTDEPGENGPLGIGFTDDE